MAGDSHVELLEQLASDAAGGDTRRGFACAGALEHVADVVAGVLSRLTG